MFDRLCLKMATCIILKIFSTLVKTFQSYYFISSGEHDIKYSAAARNWCVLKSNLWTIIVLRQYYGLNNIGLYLLFYEILNK